MTGGLGNDLFVFSSTLNASTNVDEITDFNVANDTIELNSSIFTALTQTGTLDVAAFVANAGGTAANASQHIILDTTTGDLYYDADGNGSGAAVKFAHLDSVVVNGVSNISQVTHADFTVI